MAKYVTLAVLESTDTLHGSPPSPSQIYIASQMPGCCRLPRMAGWPPLTKKGWGARTFRKTNTLSSFDIVIIIRSLHKYTHKPPTHFIRVDLLSLSSSSAVDRVSCCGLKIRRSRAAREINCSLMKNSWFTFAVVAVYTASSDRVHVS